MPHTKTKERMTVSLSRESAKFLRAQRAEAQSPSMSALLEKIVGDLQGRIEMEQLDARMQAHYDSFRESDMQEEAAWGALGKAALVSQTDEPEHQPQLARAKA